MHVLRNAAIPIVTNVMIQLPGLLAGAFLIERFFSIPGIGREVILAVERSDFPVIKAVTVYVAIATMVVNLLADLLVQGARPAGAAQMSLLARSAWRRFLDATAVGVASRAVVARSSSPLRLASAARLAGARLVERGRRELCAARVSWHGRELRTEQTAADGESAVPADDYGIEDPIGPELAEIASAPDRARPGTEAKAATLPFGADKWGRDVLKKAIKGTETSLLVGLRGGRCWRRCSAPLFGALAGYYGALDRRLLQLALQRVHVDPLSAAGAGGRRGARPEGHR